MAVVHKTMELGAGLNFKIVGGTTQPTSPKENTIWINTDTAIGEYQFSSAEPTKRADGTALQNGDVWIKNIVSSQNGFNALKKNGIEVKPISAEQYVGGAWVDKKMQLYQNGTWKSLSPYLYYYGEEFENVTGGWVGIRHATNYALGTLTKEEDAMYFYCGDVQSLQVKTTNKIDLTQVKQIELILEGSAGVGDVANLYATSNTTWGEWVANVCPNGITNKFVLDVTSLSGAYYVAFGLYIYHFSPAYYTTRIKSVRLIY